MRIQRVAMGAVVALLWTVAASTAHAGDGRKALSILPRDTAGVFVINVDRFKGSPYFADAMSFFKSRAGLEANVETLREAVGDMEKDIDTVIVGLASKGTSDPGVMVFEGRIDADKVAKAAAATDGVVKSKHRGVAYWEWKDGDGAVAVVGKRFVAATSKKRLKAVIDTFKGKKKSLAKNKAIKDLVKHVDASKDMWVVVNSSALKAAMPNLDGITGSADLAKGLTLTMDFLMSDKLKANELKSQADLMLQSGTSQPIVGPLLKNVSVTQSGTEIVVNASFDDAQLKMIGMMMSKMGGKTF